MIKRYLLFPLLVFSAVCAIAQPVTIEPPSANIQPGESVTLTASGATYYTWSPATGLSTTEGPVVVASPMVTTTYTCSGYAPGAESVVNGNFDQGNVGFTSAYQYNTNLFGEGTYYVDYDASLHHENFVGLGHGGTGNFMIVNGATVPGINVWTEEITVVPYTYYAFSTWVCTLAGTPDQVALLQFSINGNQIGDIFSAPPQLNTWQQFYELWYSGSSTSATITILNQNTGVAGNDFGLDDISFCEIVLVGAPECTVSVGSMSASATADDTELCEGESTTLHALPVNGSGNYTYSWTPANTLDDPTSQHPVATPLVGFTSYTCQIEDVGWNNTAEVNVGVTVYPTYDETTIDAAICDGESYDFFGTSIGHSVSYYPHTLQTIYGCDSIIRLNLTVYAQPVADAGEDQTLPYPGLTTQLVGSGGGNGFNYRWEPADKVVNPNNPNTETVVLRETQRFVLTVTNPQGGCTSVDTMYVYIGTAPLNANASASLNTLCDGESTQLHVEANGGSGPDNFTYSWTGSNGFTSSQQDPEVTPLVGTNTYTCTITDNITTDIITTNPVTVMVYEHHLNVPYTVDHSYPLFQCDSIPFEWFGDTIYFKDDKDYRIPADFPDEILPGQTIHGCDTSMVVTVRDMQYTPHPGKIHPDESAVWSGDLGPNVDDTVYVVTNTEFFSFQYTFRIKETKHNKTECLWNSCKWSIDKPSWSIDTIPGGVQIQNDTCYSECTVYVAERDENYVVLTAIISNDCKIKTDTCKIYLKSSFLGIDEQDNAHPDFSIIPNPNDGQMELYFSHFEGKVDVKVYDVLGNLIDSFVTFNDSESNIIEYNLDGLNGLYFIVANGKEETVAKKVIIR